MQQRIQRQPFLALFDGADPNASTPDRPPTTSPLQALYFLNSPRAHELSSSFADRVLRGADNPADQIDLAWKLAFGRSPTGDEQARTLDYFTKAASIQAAWESLARALLASNEFAFID
jgi:hypothetical protein